MRVCCVVTPQGLGLWVAGIQSGAEFGYFVSTPARVSEVIVLWLVPRGWRILGNEASWHHECSGEWVL